MSVENERKEIKEATLASIDDYHGPWSDKLIGLIDYVLSNASDDTVHEAYQYADGAAISATIDFSAVQAGHDNPEWYQKMLGLCLYLNAFRDIFHDVTGVHWTSVMDFMDKHDADEFDSFAEKNFDDNVVAALGQ